MVTCRGGGCWPLGPSGPPLAVSRGVRVTARPSPWELTFVSNGVADYLGLPAAGAGTTTGLLLASRSRGQLAFAIYTAAAPVPASDTGLASVMVDSFATAS